MSTDFSNYYTLKDIEYKKLALSANEVTKKTLLAEDNRADNTDTILFVNFKPHQRKSNKNHSLDALNILDLNNSSAHN